MATAAKEVVAAEETRVRGRVDAVDGHHLFGWVQDDAHPGDRLTVEVSLDGRVVATGLADRPRIDLRRNGIGDGGHAFDLPLPDEALAARGRLVVTAISPATGARAPLPVPGAAELAAEAVIATPLAGILDRLEVLVAAQRKLILSQRDLLAGQAANDASNLADRSGEIEALLATARVAREETAARFDAMDVFLLRFDATVAGLDERVGHLRRDVAAPLRRMLVAVGGLAGVATLAALAAVASLLLRH
jgi:hypothetical protein